MIVARRKFLTGLGAMIAAPAIVHAGNLMPIKALKELSFEDSIALLKQRMAECNAVMRRQITHTIFYGSEDPPVLFSGFQTFPLKPDWVLKAHTYEIKFDK